MHTRHAFWLVLFLAAMPVLAQDVKSPKIEPADFKDPGPVAYKFIKGKKESYTTESVTKTNVGVSVMGQEMTINTEGTSRSRTVYTVLDDGSPARVEMVTERMRVKQKVDNPMMPVEVTIEDKKITAKSGDQVVYDSEKGGDDAMAAQFTQAVRMLGEKVILTVDPNGKAGSKFEGDPEVVKLVRGSVSQGVFPVIWANQSSLKVGDTWEVETETQFMERVELKAPTKMKVAYKVLGGAKVDGVECVELEVTVANKLSNLEASMEQGGMQIDLKIASMAVNMKGKAYYDPAQNRVIFADMKGTVEMEATGEFAGAGNMEFKAHTDVRTVTRYNVPW